MNNIMRYLAVVAVFALTLSFAQADSSNCPADDSSSPKTTDAAEAPVQVAEQPPLDPELIALLEKIENASTKINSLKCKLRYDKIDLAGDEQRRFGVGYFASGPPAKFAAHFDSLFVDGRKIKQDRWFIFDGRWIAVRFDDEKSFRKYETISPKADPEKADPLAVGDGPFAVPIRFNKDRLQKRFVISRIEPDADEDPKSDPTIHLHLKARPGFDRELQSIDLWYDCQTLLPRRVLTLNQSEEEKIIDFLEIELNVEMNDQRFDTREPSARGIKGYKEEIKPWEE